MADKDILAEELDAFEEAAKAESKNRIQALDSLKFSRLGLQWPDEIKKKREQQDRPMLTINHMPAFIRQVVNDSRQSKPQIVVKPVDGAADKATAKVYSGLIKAIETQSKADIAYDTAVDFAASMGFGYIRVSVEYDFDDSFDKSIRINPVANPFSVYGDPNSTSSDGSDWNRAFVTDLISKAQFEAKYKGADKVDWTGSGYGGLNTPWRQDDSVLIAESWLREEVPRNILLLSDQSVVGEDEYKIAADYYDQMGISVVTSRQSKSQKVTQRIMTGAEILETNEWAGRYIPIVPVYGEEVNVEGERFFLSLIHHAMDSQRMFNYWRTTATELVALSPRVPYIGHEGAFEVDPEKWLTANTEAHAYLEVKKGIEIPQRQSLDTGTAAGSMTQALQASDDMKAIIGLYDASLGKRSNETSGVAINARKHEGDVSTFHIHDNRSRSIRQVGNICVDLIPKTYGKRQIIRILGNDGSESHVNIGTPPEGQPAQPPQPTPQQQMQGPQDQAPLVHEATGMEHVYDLGVGKYDVVVDTGPSYTTKREETASQMVEFLKSFPQAAPYVGDLMVKALDWQNADEIAARLKAMLPQQAQGGLPPDVQQMIDQGKQHIQEQKQQIDQLTQANNIAKIEKGLQDKANAIKLQEKDLQIKKMEAVDAVHQAAEQASQTAMPQDQSKQQAPVSLNIPDNIGKSITDAITPAISEAVASGMTQALGSIPPLQVNHQRMKRTPVRDHNGLIMHTIDEPINDQPMVN